MDTIELYRKRYELLGRLNNIYPIELQAQNRSRWTSYFSYDDLTWKKHFYSPSLHYRILPCEIVIEIGWDDPDNLFLAIDQLRGYGIEVTYGFSGGKSWHLHFFIKPPKMSLTEFAEHPEAKKFSKTIFLLLSKYLRQEGVEAIDVQPMMHGRIRSFYSQHIKTGNFKMPFNLSDGDIPYPVWTVSKVWYRLYKLHEPQTFDDVDVSDESSEVISKALALLEPYRKRETTTYIYFVCPFHQPDSDPSFTFHKKRKIFTDWHNGKIYTASKLLSILS